MNERDIIRELAEQTSGFVTCWTDERTSMGDFDGRDWTLELFDVPMSQQRSVHARLWQLGKMVRNSLGHSLMFIFHRPEETKRLYPWARKPGTAIPLDEADPNLPRVPARQLVSRPDPEQLAAAKHQRAA